MHSESTDTGWPNDSCEVGLDSVPPTTLVFQMMAERVRHRKSVPFVGAGLSIPCGYPGWTAFLRSEASRIGVQAHVDALIAMNDYEGAATYLDRELHPNGIAPRIRLVYGNDTAKLSGAIRLLLDAFLGSIVTTNFDTVIEQVAAANAIRLDTVWGARIGAVREAAFGTQRLLIKLHGDARDESHRVLTREEYTRFYGDDPKACDPTLPTVQVLSRLYETASLVFMGCSLGGDRTMTLLAATRRSIAAPEHFAILEYPGEDDTLITRRRQLDRLGISPLWYPHGRHDLVTDILRALAT